MWRFWKWKILDMVILEECKWTELIPKHLMAYHQLGTVPSAGKNVVKKTISGLTEIALTRWQSRVSSHRQTCLRGLKRKKEKKNDGFLQSVEPVFYRGMLKWCFTFLGSWRNHNAMSRPKQQEFVSSVFRLGEFQIKSPSRRYCLLEDWNSRATSWSYLVLSSSFTEQCTWPLLLAPLFSPHIYLTFSCLLPTSFSVLIWASFC